MIKLKLTDTQFATIYQLLSYVRLGEGNRYVEAISDLLNDLAYDGAEEYTEGLRPKLAFTFNDNEGMVIELE